MGIDFAEQAIPLVDPTLCTRCARCADTCPTETLVVEDGRIAVAHKSFMGCIGCGQCMMVCESGAIRVTGRRLSPADLVEIPPGPATLDQLDALLLARRSVRRYTPREVEEEVIHRILDAASTAPTGIPPTEVGVIVFGTRTRVRSFAGDVVAGFRRTCRDLRPSLLPFWRPFLGRVDYTMLRQFVLPLFREIADEWDQGRDVLFYDAPAVLLFHRGPRSDAADPHIAATYAMLAAHALGLGTCLIGTMAVLEHDRRLRRKVGIPDGHRVGLGLTVGYPAVSYARGIRRRWSSLAWA